MNILLVDDEHDTRVSLSKFLKKLGHTVVFAGDGIEALREFHAQTFDVVITDLCMPEMDGLKFLRQVRYVEQSPVEFVIITGHGDMDSAIEALKYRAYDYLKKPINVRDLASILEKIEDHQAARENEDAAGTEIRKEVEGQDHPLTGSTRRKSATGSAELDDICVYSEAMRQVISLAEKFSEDHAIPVLIQGETGTGKELVARFIHNRGKEKQPIPFVAINCGAVSPHIFEAELFGHEKGAYTGATSRGRMGKLEAAGGGTLFLDEISEMPKDLQVKLLRVLEEYRFYRVGGIREIPVDFRLISATNRDLQNEVNRTRFRPDLFYRINTGIIEIPPLRDRREGILPLALHFAKQASKRRRKPFLRFARETEDFLTGYNWPGNVRQLKNCIDRVLLLAPGGEITMEDLSFLIDGDSGAELQQEAAPIIGETDFELPDSGLDFQDISRQIIEKALAKHKGNQTAAAQYLGISRRVLQGRLSKLSINRKMGGDS